MKDDTWTNTSGDMGEFKANYCNAAISEQCVLMCWAQLSHVSQLRYEVKYYWKKRNIQNGMKSLQEMMLDIVTVT